MTELTVTNHDRDSAGRTYVYPVVARRSRGVSIGINLNPNAACNWRCVYCQVEGLKRGKGPKIDLERLEHELESMLRDVVEGDFMKRRVPDPDMRRLNDVAFSGDGESTTCPDFPAVVDLTGRILERIGILGKIKLVLITNGSMVRREEIAPALARFREMGGEIWFKLDRGRNEDIKRTNDVALDVETHLDNLRAVAAIAPTFIQTCMFGRDGHAPADDEVQAWLDVLARLVEEQVPLRGVLLYGLARQSAQPEAASLHQLPLEWMEALGDRVRALGLEVQVSA